MKRTLYALMLLLFVGCARKNGSVESRDALCDEEVSHLLCPIDSIPLKNGNYVMRIFAVSPMNEMISWCDRNGRPLVTYSHASECDQEVLSFFYRKDGKLGRVLCDRGWDILDERCTNLDSLFFVIYNSGRERSFHADGYLSCYEFGYDADGRLRSIREIGPENGNCEEVVAETGRHLEGDFRPGGNYWASDLWGGTLNMVCSEVPDTIDGRDYTLRRWVNFRHLTTRYYENGRLALVRGFYKDSGNAIVHRDVRNPESESAEQTLCEELDLGGDVFADAGFGPFVMSAAYRHYPKIVHF